MKEHGVQTYILWRDDDGGACALLIEGDPPSRHLLLQPRAIYTFEASSYHEARVKQHAFLGWIAPTYEHYDYPPQEYLK